MIKWIFFLNYLTEQNNCYLNDSKTNFNKLKNENRIKTTQQYFSNNRNRFI